MVMCRNAILKGASAVYRRKFSVCNMSTVLNCNNSSEYKLGFMQKRRRFACGKWKPELNKKLTFKFWRHSNSYREQDQYFRCSFHTHGRSALQKHLPMICTAYYSIVHASSIILLRTRMLVPDVDNRLRLQNSVCARAASKFEKLE